MDVLDADISINDEATANVAPENEADLMNAVEELTKEKTIIMIAHRLKTVRKADQILVIEKGRIAEQGTHDVLLQKNGIYSSFICSRKEAVSWKVLESDRNSHPKTNRINQSESDRNSQS